MQGRRERVMESNRGVVLTKYSMFMAGILEKPL
jgi:hypothetical protein